MLEESIRSFLSESSPDYYLFIYTNETGLISAPQHATGLVISHGEVRLEPISQLHDRLLTSTAIKRKGKKAGDTVSPSEEHEIDFRVARWMVQGIRGEINPSKPGYGIRVYQTWKAYEGHKVKSMLRRLVAEIAATFPSLGDSLYGLRLKDLVTGGPLDVWAEGLEEASNEGELISLISADGTWITDMGEIEGTNEGDHGGTVHLWLSSGSDEEDEELAWQYDDAVAQGMDAGGIPVNYIRSSGKDPGFMAFRHSGRPSDAALNTLAQVIEQLPKGTEVEWSTRFTTNWLKSSRADALIAVERMRRLPRLSESKHDFSCVLLSIDNDAQKALLAHSSNILDSDLAGDGRELETHCTIKYGLHTNNVNDLLPLLKDHKPIRIKFGKVTSFTPSESSDWSSPLKYDIESDDLIQLNTQISAILTCTDTHPDYKPHVTLGYIKPDRVKIYEGDGPLTGKTFECNTVIWSGKDGKTIKIKLPGGEFLTEETLSPSEVNNYIWTWEEEGFSLRVTDKTTGQKCAEGYYIGGEPNPDPGSSEKPDHREFHISVFPSYRNRGIGKYLVNVFFQKFLAERRTNPKLELSMYATPYVASMVQKLGFGSSLSPRTYDGQQIYQVWYPSTKAQEALSEATEEGPNPLGWLNEKQVGEIADILYDGIANAIIEKLRKLEWSTDYFRVRLDTPSAATQLLSTYKGKASYQYPLPSLQADIRDNQSRGNLFARGGEGYFHHTSNIIRVVWEARIEDARGFSKEQLRTYLDQTTMRYIVEHELGHWNTLGPTDIANRDLEGEQFGTDRSGHMDPYHARWQEMATILPYVARLKKQGWSKSKVLDHLHNDLLTSPSLAKALWTNADRYQVESLDEATRQSLWLARYLKDKTIDPYQYEYLISEWDDTKDNDVYFADLTPEEQKAFTEWLESGEGQEHKERNDEQDPVEADPRNTIDFERHVPPSTWLVHFTNEPESIASQGFIYGSEERGLHLTTWKGEKERKSGWGTWAFAMEADSREASINGDSSSHNRQYGKHAVMFRSTGAVETWHHGDEQRQVIFSKSMAKDFVPLYYDDNTYEWTIRNRETERVIYKTEKWLDIVHWVEQNYAQYQNVIGYRQAGTMGQPEESLEEDVRAFLEERYGGSSKLRSIWFHGTGMDNLSKVLSQGLIPNPKKKAWAEDPHANWHQPSRASYGGIYVTKSYGTAKSSSQRWNAHGPYLIVIMELQPRSLVVDEDDFSYYLRDLSLPNFSPNEYTTSMLYFTLRKEGLNDKWVQGQLAFYKKKFFDKLEYDKVPMSEQLKAAIDKQLENCFVAEVTRKAAYFQDMDYWQSNYHRATDDEPQNAPPVPDKREAERGFRDALDQLTKTLKRYVEAETIEKTKSEIMMQTARSMEPIGFSGSNKIVGIVEVRNGNAENHYKSSYVIHYGDIPSEALQKMETHDGAGAKITRAKDAAFAQESVEDEIREFVGEAVKASNWQARIPAIQKKHPKMSANWLSLLAGLYDPTPNKEFLDWLADRAAEDEPDENGYEETEWQQLPYILKEFARLKAVPAFTGSRNIYEYPSIEQLEDVVLQNVRTLSKGATRREAEKQGQKVILRMGKYVVTELSTWQAAHSFCYEGKWSLCIKDPSWAKKHLPVYMVEYDNKGVYGKSPIVAFDFDGGEVTDPGDNSLLFASYRSKEFSKVPEIIAAVAKKLGKSTDPHDYGKSDVGEALTFLEWQKSGRKESVDESLRLTAAQAAERFCGVTIAESGSVMTEASEEHMEFLMDIHDEELINIVDEFKRKKGKGRLSWPVIPAARLIKIWQDYAKTGFVRDEAGMEWIKDRMLHNVQRLHACTELMGHTPTDMRPELEDQGYEFTDEEWEYLMPHFLSDKHGSWRLSDYGLEPLNNLSFQLLRAKTAEEQLQVVDQMLNVVHMRSDMAANFVQGGRTTLGRLATESVNESLFSKLSSVKPSGTWILPNGKIYTAKGLDVHHPETAMEVLGITPSSLQDTQQAIATLLLQGGITINHGSQVGYDTLYFHWEKPSIEALRVLENILYEFARKEKNAKVVASSSDFYDNNEAIDKALERIEQAKEKAQMGESVRQAPSFWRIYYHCTSADRIASIAAKGLIPAEETNWGGDLGSKSYGKIFVGNEPRKAAYYGMILFQNTLESEGSASAPILLRIVPRVAQFKGDIQDPGSLIADKTVPPDRIQGLWQGQWIPIAKHPAVEYGEEWVYERGEGYQESYKDWDGTEYETIEDAVADAKKLVTVTGREASTESIEEASLSLQNKAIKYFGLTDDPRLAGYILRDGRMLDLSGRNMGAVDVTSRQLDHREVSQFVRDEDDATYAMIAFCERTGAIRTSIFAANAPSDEQQTTTVRSSELWSYMAAKQRRPQVGPYDMNLDIYTAPTEAQYRRIASLLPGADVVVIDAQKPAEGGGYFHRHEHSRVIPFIQKAFGKTESTEQDIRGFLSEAPPPSPWQQEQMWYHGTPGTERAKQIAQYGIRPNSITKYQDEFAPRKGFVYLTRNKETAADFALDSERLTKDDPYGYIFEIPGSQLKDVEPDEDIVQQMLQEIEDAKAKEDFGAREREEDEDEPEWDELEFATDPPDVPDWLEPLQNKLGYMGDSSIVAAKAILKKMTAAQKQQIMDWHEGEEWDRIAHKGVVRPTRVWRLSPSTMGNWKEISISSLLGESILDEVIWGDPVTSLGANKKTVATNDPNIEVVVAPNNKVWLFDKSTQRTVGSGQFMEGKGNQREFHLNIEQEYEGRGFGTIMATQLFQIFLAERKTNPNLYLSMYVTPAMVNIVKRLGLTVMNRDGKSVYGGGVGWAYYGTGGHSAQTESTEEASIAQDIKEFLGEAAIGQGTWIWPDGNIEHCGSHVGGATEHFGRFTEKALAGSLRLWMAPNGVLAAEAWGKPTGDACRTLLDLIRGGGVPSVTLYRRDVSKHYRDPEQAAEEVEMWMNESVLDSTIPLVDRIKALSSKYNLFGGNCGVFANALARYLIDQGKQPTLIFVGNNPEGNYDESDLYHVMVGADGQFYDGSGLIGDQQTAIAYAEKFVKEEYQDDDPAVHSALYDAEVAREVRTNTNYGVPEDTLYHGLRKGGIQESILDPTMPTLDPQIFDLASNEKHPQMKSGVRQELLDAAKAFEQWGTISRVFVKGSALSMEWLPTSDIDVAVVIEPTSDESMSPAIDYTAQHEDDLLPGTQHPIQFFLLKQNEVHEESYDGIYDLINDTWVKGPYSLHADVPTYMEKFKGFLKNIDMEKGELVREIVDFEELASLSNTELERMQPEVEAVLEEINASVRNLVGSYEVAHAVRSMAFSADLTLADIDGYRSKNLLPGNILYKLLERYHYMKMLKGLKKALKKAGGKIDEPEDVGDVKQAIENFCLDEAYLSDYERIRGIAWNVRRAVERLRTTDPGASVRYGDLCGACAIASYMLFKKLYDLGYHPVFVEGDNHCVVTVRDYVIDITAKQFVGDYWRMSSREGSESGGDYPMVLIRRQNDPSLPSGYWKKFRSSITGRARTPSDVRDLLASWPSNLVPKHMRVGRAKTEDVEPVKGALGEASRDPENYHWDSIGHTDYYPEEEDDDTGRASKDIVWYWDKNNNQLIVDTGDMSHATMSGIEDEEDTEKYWRGRFDARKRIVSIAPPSDISSRIRSGSMISSTLLSHLRARFGNAHLLFFGDYGNEWVEESLGEALSRSMPRISDIMADGTWIWHDGSMSSPGDVHSDSVAIHYNMGEEQPIPKSYDDLVAYGMKRGAILIGLRPHMGGTHFIFANVTKPTPAAKMTFRDILAQAEDYKVTELRLQRGDRFFTWTPEEALDKLSLFESGDEALTARQISPPELNIQETDSPKLTAAQAAAKFCGVTIA